MLASRLPVLTATLYDQRRGLLLWALALVGLTVMYGAFYPEMAVDDALEVYLDALPEGFSIAMGFEDISTAAGYLTSTVYALLAPLLLLVFALTTGTRLVAGDEEAGTLELTVTHPVSRHRVLLERAGALVVAVALLSAAVGLATGGLAVGYGLDLPGENIVAATVGLGAFALAFGLLGLAAGAVSGRRAASLGIVAAVALASYVLDALSRLAEPLEGWERASPFHWYVGGDPLADGWDLGGLALLGAVAVVALIVAVWRFDRRDLGV